MSQAFDYRIRGTAAEGTLRALATLSTRVARTAQAFHQARPVAAAAMGRAASAAILMAADLKDGGIVHLEISGGGPLGRVVAEADPVSVRVRVDHPAVELPLRPDGKLAVGQAVGRDGHLLVRREDPDGHRFESRVALASGEIGEDLTRFYAESEQVPTAVALGVLVGRDGVVAASGGVVVQALPGSEEVAEGVADRFGALARISQRIAGGETPEDLLASVLPPPLRLAPREAVRFRCRCSKERSEAIVRSLPIEDLEALWEERGAEVTCNFCRQVYRFGADEIGRWLEAREGKSPRA